MRLLVRETMVPVESRMLVDVTEAVGATGTAGTALTVSGVALETQVYLLWIGRDIMQIPERRQ